MKNKFQKIYAMLLGVIPICTAIMLTISANSTGCWIKGQEELPEGAKRYRKF